MFFVSFPVQPSAEDAVSTPDGAVAHEERVGGQDESVNVGFVQDSEEEQ